MRAYRWNGVWKIKENTRKKGVTVAYIVCVGVGWWLGQWQDANSTMHGGEYVGNGRGGT